jgi:hypothetical protein
MKKKVIISFQFMDKFLKTRKTYQRLDKNFLSRLSILHDPAGFLTKIETWMRTQFDFKLSNYWRGYLVQAKLLLKHKMAIYARKR